MAGNVSGCAATAAAYWCCKCAVPVPRTDTGAHLRQTINAVSACVATAIFANIWSLEAPEGGVPPVKVCHRSGWRACRP